jgi:hypothetical protein
LNPALRLGVKQAQRKRGKRDQKSIISSSIKVEKMEAKVKKICKALKTEIPKLM